MPKFIVNLSRGGHGLRDFLTERLPEARPDSVHRDLEGAFGEARVAKEGNDVSLISYGRQVNLLLRVADRLANEEKIDAEVIDLRSIRPFDTDTIVASVRKTHRAVVVQEQWRWFSVASEVAAIIQEQAFDYLDAPVGRVSGAEVPAPYARNLELAVFPSENDVIKAVHQSLYREA